MGQYELDDDLWEGLMELIRQTARDRGVDHDMYVMLAMIKEFYHIVDDPAALKGECEDGELKELEKRDAEQDASSAKMKERIKELSKPKKRKRNVR